MRILQVLVLILFLASFAKAQACGYTFLTIYLTDSNGQIIKNADIKTFDKDFKEQDQLHYPGKRVSYGDRKNISWSEDNQVYFGREGMCGGHYKVGLRIEAENFENFDKVIDLPLGYTAYSIKLKRKDSDENAEISELKRISGKITNPSGGGIPQVVITALSNEKTTFKTLTNSYGFYELYLPVGEFSLKISSEGFINAVIEKFIVTDSKIVKLDLTLEISSETNCPLPVEIEN